MATATETIEFAQRYYGLTAWELFVASAYLRRIQGPRRHPWRATQIFLRYQPKIDSAQEKLNAAAGEIAIAEFARLIGAATRC